MISEELRQKVRDERYKARVKQAVDSGVRPLVLKYYQINACDSKLPMAYRAVTVINSTSEGVLTPRQYHNATDKSKVGLHMAEWSVIAAMKAITKMVEAGREIAWVSVHCPSMMVSRVDMYEWMKHLIKKYDFKYPEKLCLEFMPSLLREKTADARLSVLDMKLLGVKTMLVGGASGECPISKLVSIPVDMVMLSGSVTALTGSRNKPKVVQSLVAYIQSMRAEVYAEGVLDDEQVRLLSRMDCIGYSTSAKYTGNSATERNMGFDKALCQKNTEEGIGV